MPNFESLFNQEGPEWSVNEDWILLKVPGVSRVYNNALVYVSISTFVCMHIFMKNSRRNLREKLSPYLMKKQHNSR